MSVQNYNLIEIIALETLERSLNMRYDICTCAKCRKDMLKEVLAQVAPKTVSVTREELDAAVQQAREEHQREINHVVLKAIDTIDANPGHPPLEDRKKAFRRLLERILQDRGLDFRNYHIDLLKRRFALRIKLNNLSSYTEYMNLLARQPQEYEKLFETLCINVSEFFRDKPVWITIRYLIETLAREKMRNNDTSLRIWSAGCACGEEMYSMAILLREVLKTTLLHFKVELFATDVDKACLNTAQKAEYPKDRLINTEPELVSKYFAVSGDNYRVLESVKSMVAFNYLDLTSQEYLKDIDILLCRNVFIYFNKELQHQILKQFHESLRLNGYIVLGKSENMVYEMKNYFEDTDSNARIYRKI
ncbi:MAG TPA: protein-glutamate O-methyltransferase CheR [Candidatus Omnitrophota bacterium]|nr:protein-glutamate O-methyltransferase CheR [Candidatus Omnitrophota bacterium]